MKSWIYTHKFWSSVIVLLLIGLLASMLGIVDAYLLGTILGIYIFFGGLLWIVLRNKKGRNDNGSNSGRS